MQPTLNAPSSAHILIIKSFSCIIDLLLLIFTAQGSIKGMMFSCYFCGKSNSTLSSSGFRTVEAAPFTQHNLFYFTEASRWALCPDISFLSVELDPLLFPLVLSAFSASKHNTSDAKPSCGACLTVFIGFDAEIMPALFTQTHSMDCANDNMQRCLCIQMCMWRIQGGAPL